MDSVPKYWPPTPFHTACFPPPALKAGGHTFARGWGGGGSIFWKKPDIELASYSIIPYGTGRKRSIDEVTKISSVSFWFTCHYHFSPRLIFNIFREKYSWGEIHHNSAKEIHRVRILAKCRRWVKLIWRHSSEADSTRKTCQWNEVFCKYKTSPCSWKCACAAPWRALQYTNRLKYGVCIAPVVWSFFIDYCTAIRDT